MRSQRSCVECEVKGPHCFCTLETGALRRLDGLGTSIHLAPNQSVFREGSLPDKVYVVCRGTIKLTTSSSDGRLLILRIVGAGDVLGLSAAMRQCRYEATAETLEPCSLKAIPRTQFLLFMEEFQAVSRNSALAVARHYGAAVMSARRLALSNNASAKLAGVLLDWGNLTMADDTPYETDMKSANHTSFVMPLSHEELGQMAGLSRETVTRVLTVFRRDGLVQMVGERMVLSDLEGLSRLAH